MSSARFTVSVGNGTNTADVNQKESNSKRKGVIISQDVQVEIIEQQNDTTQHDRVFESGNLALYEDELHKRPKISSLLSSLSTYEAVPTAPTEEEEGTTALKRSQGTKMGTLMGVYLPTIQNIFGVILFIRLSWIVGVSGVAEAFLIVLTCCCCLYYFELCKEKLDVDKLPEQTKTMLTAISMSAIATNGVVPAGGSYFMISRALGPEFGGAVGLLFYLATSFAAAMYILGAIEILLTYMAPMMSLFGDVRSGGGAQSATMLNNMRVYGSILLLLLSLIVLVGVKYVNKCASIFLACVLLSIVAIYVGFFTAQLREMPKICLLGDRLLSASSYVTCSKNDTLLEAAYGQNGDAEFWNKTVLRYITGVPGITSGIFTENIRSKYVHEGEFIPGVPAGNYKGEVRSDITTSFFILLAIFFPSVTGIMAGSNRSGDLKDAQQSIPKGTIAAISTTSFVYLTSILFFGATMEGALLRDKFGESIGSVLVVANIAWPSKWVILIGSFLSTVGAGMQSLTGAPRLLQAIARDNLIPILSRFGHGSKNGEPTQALLITVCISEIGILIANLDQVAPIITMFFLMCYGFVNLACVLQSLLRTPNWRPRFKYYHWFTSFLGLCLCIGLMFISSWYYALVAIIIAAGIYKYIEFQGAKKEWGDGIRGLKLSAARFALMSSRESQTHTKNWRPQILALAKLKEDFKPRSTHLLSFLSQLKAGKGLAMVGCVLEGSYRSRAADVATAKEVISSFMKKEKVKGFNLVVAASNVEEGLSFLIQGSGLGSLVPNTVMVAWPENWREKQAWTMFVHVCRCVSEGQEALLVPRGIDQFPDNTQRLEGHMDVWWIVHDGGMMILLLFLLKQHKVWRRCKLRIFAVAQMKDNSVQMKKDLEIFIYHLRISATVEVIEMTDEDISEYTYERTLIMEQRFQLLRQLSLTKRESKREIQGVVGTSYRARSISSRHNSDATLGEDCNQNQHSGGSHTNAAILDEDLQQERHVPAEKNVRRMNTAVKLNEIVKEKSEGSQLVVINLPGPPKDDNDALNYMEFLDVLTEGLDRVLMVRGGGREVITIYS